MLMVKRATGAAVGRLPPDISSTFFDDLDSQDEEGIELASIEDARTCAVRCIRVVASGRLSAGHLDLEHCTEVNDEAGRELLRKRFGDAIRVRDG